MNYNLPEYDDLLVQLSEANDLNSKLMAEMTILKQRNQIMSERVEDTTHAFKTIQCKNENLDFEFQIEKKQLIDTFDVNVMQLMQQLNEQDLSKKELSETNDSLSTNINSYEQQIQTLQNKVQKQRNEVLELKKQVNHQKYDVLERDAQLVEYYSIINEQNIIIDDLRQKLAIKSLCKCNESVRGKNVFIWGDKSIRIPSTNSALSTDASSRTLVSNHSPLETPEGNAPLLKIKYAAIAIPNSVTSKAVEMKDDFKDEQYGAII